MSPGAVWSRRLGMFSFVLLLTVGLAHRYGLVGTLDLPPLFGTCVVLAFGGVTAGLVAHRRYWFFGDRGGRDVFWGLFWSLTTLLPFLFVGYFYVAYPKLTDISTDLENPPSMTSAERSRSATMNPIVDPTPERVIMQADGYPLIEGRRYELPFDRVLLAVQNEIQRRGWTNIETRDIVGMSLETDIEALAYSPLLAFPADVAVRLVDEGTSTFVDMRSVSRYGPHDLGDNAARISGFLAELDNAMSAQVGVTGGG